MQTVFILTRWSETPLREFSTSVWGVLEALFTVTLCTYFNILILTDDEFWLLCTNVVVYVRPPLHCDLAEMFDVWESTWCFHALAIACIGACFDSQ